MRSSNVFKNVAFPWAALVAIISCGPFRQLFCEGSTASLRATRTASSKQPPVWERPALERYGLVNGSLTLETLKVSGMSYCNSVCGSMMDFAVVADVSASVGPSGVLYTQLFLSRLLSRFRLGQGKGQQLAAIIEAGMDARLLTGLTDKSSEYMDGVNKLTLRGGALNLMAGLGMAETSFMHGRQDAHSLVLAIVDGPALRQRLTIQMAQKISRTADLVVILVAASFDTAAQLAATEWLKAAGSCTPYGCRLLQIADYESLARVDTTGVIAEICPNLV